LLLPLDQQLDGVGQMLAVNIVIAIGDTDLVSFDHHLSMAATLRGLEPVAREFDQKTERIAETDRVHEPAILWS
jgi:hypothetical protein